MQAKNLSGGQELICINVDKVYDWIVKEKSFDYALPSGNIVFTPTNEVPSVGTPGSPVGVSSVKCTVTPAKDNPVQLIDRTDRPYVIDGTSVILQQLNIRKNFVITLCVTLTNGAVLTSQTPSTGVNQNLLLSRYEVVTMCAPEGTEIEITYTDLDCFIVTPGTFTLPNPAATGSLRIEGLTLSVITCQSIQSTYPVTVEFLAEFCDPREDLATECPAPTRPLQCPVVFPNVG